MSCEVIRDVNCSLLFFCKQLHSEHPPETLDTPLDATPLPQLPASLSTSPAPSSLSAEEMDALERCSWAILSHCERQGMWLLAQVSLRCGAVLL